PGQRTRRPRDASRGRPGGEALSPPARLRGLRSGLSRRASTAPPAAMDHALPDAAFVPPAEAPGTVVVGLSGGLDSTVLLHRLARQPGFRDRGLRALHVHHGLHPDADGWALHCARLCAELGVALDVHRVDVARDSGLGPEAAARAARHAAFAAGLGAGDILALAHHLDDQAETFLLR